MTVNPTQSAPGAEGAVPQLPATSELVSGHNTEFVGPESLDARPFSDFERFGAQRR